MVAFASVMTIVYPLGCPLLLFVLLFKYRALLNPASMDEDKAIQSRKVPPLSSRTSQPAHAPALAPALTLALAVALPSFSPSHSTLILWPYPSGGSGVGWGPSDELLHDIQATLLGL